MSEGTVTASEWREFMESAVWGELSKWLEEHQGDLFTLLGKLDPVEEPTLMARAQGAGEVCETILSLPKTFSTVKELDAKEAKELEEEEERGDSDE